MCRQDYLKDRHTPPESMLDNPGMAPGETIHSPPASIAQATIPVMRSWQLVEGCGEREQEVAPTYLNNLGELCDESEGRGSVRVGAFDVMLHDTEAVIQRRESKYLGAALTRSRL